jgi:capsule biosynthesis phosphatase
MIILIPLGGKGDRFRTVGYKKPKALINIFGKPILYYLLDNLKINQTDLIYIPYNKEYEQYRFQEQLKKDYHTYNFKFLKLDTDTRGAAHTINIALTNLELNNDDCIICVDSDNFYTCDILNMWNKDNQLFTINDTNLNPIYSYIKIDNNFITDIVEKEKISNNACTGAYGFKSWKMLLKYTSYVIDKNLEQKNELYTSSVIKLMLSENIKFTNQQINSTMWHCLGTPIQLKLFYNNFPAISCIDNKQNLKKMRFCFDLDNTLVTHPLVKDDYTTVNPIINNINFLRYIKKFGHTIIIYTARRMKTHNGNNGKIMADIGKITFDTLEKFNIPFDEIYFGKPYADVYIDDLALNCFDDLEKNTGFYMDHINPRSFNELNNDTINIYEKKSDDLSGEIYYYKNIPLDLKDLFPLFIDYDINNKWYKIEKINGITLTSMYLSQILTIDNLLHVMNSIDRIHKCKIDTTDNFNIYENYCNKLKKRYEKYDYSKFKNSEIIFNEIYYKLKYYEDNNLGRKSVIHGDTVMTNILINNFGKIKFIDMNGKLGNVLSLSGDELYDWAKLYQSLIGYDKILMDKNITELYENKMITFFIEYMKKLYDDNTIQYIKLITKSLLFSLIPLHDNDKCIKYYELLFCKYLL